MDAMLVRVSDKQANTVCTAERVHYNSTFLSNSDALTQNTLTL